ncbi:hypothetical protein PUN28_017904 [Cardiocondyla obscurior]|uniref:Uncharacterized protein n=1 Tax=Cardiocondyla obscurior TaxID=286306 RepID=A0AAW2EPT4_9HYME
MDLERSRKENRNSRTQRSAKHFKISLERKTLSYAPQCFAELGTYGPHERQSPRDTKFLRQVFTNSFAIRPRNDRRAWRTFGRIPSSHARVVHESPQRRHLLQYRTERPGGRRRTV